MFYLNAEYDSRASFYGKAIIVRNGDALTLYSYMNKVAKIEPNGNNNALTLYPQWDYSATTLRHVKEFVRQYYGIGSSKLTKKDVEKLAAK